VAWNPGLVGPHAPKIVDVGLSIGLEVAIAPIQREHWRIQNITDQKTDTSMGMMMTLEMMMTCTMLLNLHCIISIIVLLTQIALGHAERSDIVMSRPALPLSAGVIGEIPTSGQDILKKLISPVIPTTGGQ